MTDNNDNKEYLNLKNLNKPNSQILSYFIRWFIKQAIFQNRTGIKSGKTFIIETEDYINFIPQLNEKNISFVYLYIENILKFFEAKRLVNRITNLKNKIFLYDQHNELKTSKVNSIICLVTKMITSQDLNRWENRLVNPYKKGSMYLLFPSKIKDKVKYFLFDKKLKVEENDIKSLDIYYYDNENFRNFLMQKNFIFTLEYFEFISELCFVEIIWNIPYELSSKAKEIETEKLNWNV